MQSLNKILSSNTCVISSIGIYYLATRKKQIHLELRIYSVMDKLLEFPPFQYSEKTDAGPKWEKWIERLDLLFTGMDINDNGRKRALL